MVMAAAIASAAASVSAQDFGFDETTAAPVDGAIVIPLDAPLPPGDYAVEISGVDVTGFAVIDGATLLVEPGLVGPGVAEVVIYALTSAGYEIVAYFEYVIEGGAQPPSYSLTASHEIGVRNLNREDTNRFARSSGSAEVTAMNGQLNATASYLATSEANERIAGRSVDLESYAVEYNRSGGALDLIARLGDQSVSYDRALVSDITERGASLFFETPGQGLSFGVFGTEVMAPEGAENLTGLGDQDDLIYGATTAVRPFGGSDFQLGISGYAGRGAEFDGGDIGEGQGGAVFVNGSARDGRLRYGVDVGWAEWDEDAELAVFPKVDGTAVLALVEYDVFGFDNPSSLTFGLAYERVDATYFSLANTSLPSGREDIQLSFDWASEASSVGGLVNHQLTNTGGPSDEPVDRILTFNLYGSHIPYATSVAPTWLGDPSLSFDLQVISIRRKETPPAAIPPEDEDSVDALVGLYVQRETFGWGVGYGFGHIDDRTANNFDETTHSLDWSVDWQVGDLTTVGGSGYVTRFDNVDGIYTDTSLQIDATREFPDWALTWAAGVGYEDFGAPGSQDGMALTTDLTWAFAPAADLVLSGTWAEGGKAEETLDDPEWSVGLMLRARTNFFR